MNIAILIKAIPTELFIFNIPCQRNDSFSNVWYHGHRDLTTSKEEEDSMENDLSVKEKYLRFKR